MLKSASAKWRQFKANLTKDYVKPNVGNKKKLRKPPKQYAFIGKEAWKKFVAERTTRDWQVILHLSISTSFVNFSISGR